MTEGLRKANGERERLEERVNGLESLPRRRLLGKLGAIRQIVYDREDLIKAGRHTSARRTRGTAHPIRAWDTGIARLSESWRPTTVNNGCSLTGDGMVTVTSGFAQFNSFLPSATNAIVLVLASARSAE
jgi:hypothetical protein